MAREFAKSFYRSKEWKRTREYVLKRDLYLCVKCGRPAEEVHHKKHLTPNNINDINISLNPNNLISLCKECHFETHREEKIKGLKERRKESVCAEEYCFDENGFLVRRSEETSPPWLQILDVQIETVGAIPLYTRTGCAHERGL